MGHSLLLNSTCDSGGLPSRAPKDPGSAPELSMSHVTTFLDLMSYVTNALCHSVIFRGFQAIICACDFIASVNDTACSQKQQSPII